MLAQRIWGLWGWGLVLRDAAVRGLWVCCLLKAFEVEGLGVYGFFWVVLGFQ